MNEYINRALLMGALTAGNQQLAMRAMTGADAYNEFVRLVNYIQAADVVEARHGRWLKRSDGTPYCSNCGANERDTYSSVVNECAFCYSCGARMDKEDEHGN